MFLLGLLVRMPQFSKDFVDGFALLQEKLDDGSFIFSHKAVALAGPDEFIYPATEVSCSGSKT